MPIAKGTQYKYDDGTFQLKVDYDISDSAITFLPYIVVGTKGGFDHTHVAVFEWSNGKGGFTKNTQKGVNGKKTYYPDTKKTVKKSKKANKRTFKGNSLTVKCYIKKSKGTKKNSSVSQVTIKSSKGPKAPGAISVTAAGGRSQSATVKCASIYATPTRPVASMKWERLTEDITTSGWSTVGEEHTLNTSSNTLAYCTLADNGLSPGNRYKWKVTVKNNNGSGGSELTAKTEYGGWYYTVPPAVSNVSHMRLNDSTNVVFFSRDPKYHTFGIIQGYVIQYNTYEPNDPAFNGGWKDLSYTKYPGYHKGWDGNINTQSYSDIAFKHTNCSANTRYRYRICAKNRTFGGSGDWGYSAWSSHTGDEPTYNTPSKPTSLKGVVDSEMTKITLSIKAEKHKRYSTADRLFIQRKADNGPWVDVGSGTDGIDLSTLDVSSDGLTFTYEDTDIQELLGKTVKYHVAFGCSQTSRNGQVVSPIVIGDGKSAWSSEATVQLLAKPNKPNLVMPVDNGKIVIDTDTVRLGWVHSPRDGTEQKDVKIEYRLNNTGNWASITTLPNVPEIDKKAAYYDLPISNFSVNDTVNWRIATKGSHNDFSDYNEKNFKILDRPQIAITSIEDMSSISYLPIHVEWAYLDRSGTIEELTLYIRQNDENLHTIKIDQSKLDNPNEYILSDYIFDDEEEYTIRLVAKSTSGIENHADKRITIKYTTLNLVNGFTIVSEFDEETGYANIDVQRIIQNVPQTQVSDDEEEDIPDEHEEEMITSYARVKKFYVYRVYNGPGELVQGAVQEINLNEYDTRTSFSFVDREAPINSDFTYKLLQITELGEVSVSYGVDQFYETLWWYVYWGDNNVIKTRWNPQGSVTLGRPQRQEVRYSGREYPVLYDTNANEETYSYTFTILKENAPIFDGTSEIMSDSITGRDVLEQFKAMMRNGGIGIWKSFEGDVYYAKFDFNYSSNYSDKLPSWNCTLNATRLERED